MGFIIILLCASLFVGIYLILCDLVRMPSLANTKATLKITQRDKRSHSYQAIVLNLSTQLAKHIHLDAYKRRTLTATLKYAGIELSPESYLANIIVKSLSRLLLIIPCVFAAPFAIPIIVIWTISGFIDGTKEAEKIVEEKRGKIDAELPRFVATIAQELNATRDVLAMLEGYRASAGELFKNELEITIANMKSGSPEQALTRLAGRVGSGMLSQIVRGLLGVLRGDNGVIYFSLLSHDFQNLEIRKLEKDAQKRPEQMKKYSYLMLGCFVAAYIYVIAAQVYSSAGSLL